MKALLAVLFIGVISSALAGDIYNPGANSLGDYPDIDNPSSTVQPTGKILLVDGVSFLLKVDAVSKICRAGGC
jgi:hypothetical protein